MIPKYARPLVAVMGTLVLASGCATPEVHLTPLTALVSPTRGAELSPDGTVTHVGMRDTTCAFDTRTGLLLDDVNLPGAEEAMVDASRHGFVARTPEGLHLIGHTVESMPAPGAIDGLWTDTGVWVLADDGGCALKWPGGEYVAELPGAACGGALVGAADGSVAAVTGPGGTWLATAEGVVLDLQTPSTDALWWPDGDRLLLATGSEVRVFEADGSAAPDVPIVTDDLATFPDGLVGARVGRRLASFDVDTGEVFPGFDLPPDGAMVGSDRGVVRFATWDRVTLVEVTTGSLDPWKDDPQATEVFD